MSAKVNILAIYAPSSQLTSLSLNYIPLSRHQTFVRKISVILRDLWLFQFAANFENISYPLFHVHREKISQFVFILQNRCIGYEVVTRNKLLDVRILFFFHLTESDSIRLGPPYCLRDEIMHLALCHSVRVKNNRVSGSACGSIYVYTTRWSTRNHCKRVKIHSRYHGYVHRCVLLSDRSLPNATDRFLIPSSTIEAKK